MSDAPKLPSVTEWREMLVGHQFAMLEPTLRERGLIAPEPVDALLVEAREICADAMLAEGCPNAAALYREGTHDGAMRMEIALAALRRGMELAKPALTREMVADCLNHAGLLSRTGNSGIDYLWFALHTALIARGEGV